MARHLDVRRRRALLASACLAALLAAVPAAWPGAASASPPRTTELLSLTSAGAQASGPSTEAAVSDDGTVVAFRSSASNLVAGDTNARNDVFVRAGTTTTRVSVAAGGVQADGQSGPPAISADGRYVAFDSLATNLVAGDTNAVSDVFVHDRQTGTTTRVSVITGGAQANGGSLSPHLSSDGRYVVFESRATDLVAGDTNGRGDVFVHDRQTGTTTLVSVATTGGGGNGDSGSATVSGDGNLVAFRSVATDLVAGDTNVVADVFVRDMAGGSTARASVGTAGVEAQGGGSYLPRITPDGRWVAFESGATNLVAGDTNNVYDVFIYDRTGATTTRVSVNSAGAQVTGASGQARISANGRYVAFESAAGDLVSGDRNGASDAFLRDRLTGQTTRVSVSSTGVESSTNANKPAVVAQGEVVAFTAFGGDLVAGDANGTNDVVARTRSGLEVDLVAPAQVDLGDANRIVQVYGRGFSGTPVVDLGAGITIMNVTLVSATQLTVTVNVDVAAAPGYRTVSVNSSGDASTCLVCLSVGVTSATTTSTAPGATTTTTVPVTTTTDPFGGTIPETTTTTTPGGGTTGTTAPGGPGLPNTPGATIPGVTTPGGCPWCDGGDGYWIVTSGGEVLSFGDAPPLARDTNLGRATEPIAGLATQPGRNGYWLVTPSGKVYAANGAPALGDLSAIRLNRPIVGMASTASGQGYWLVAADGGIFAFGDATFYGSTGAMALNQPIVTMATTPSGRGYWLVASDGGIFSFGDAAFYGSTGAIRLNRPIVGMSPTETGHGYWLVATDGGMFAFGDAPFHGSTGAIALNQPVVGMAATVSGDGYWLVASDGGVFAFGDAPFLGSAGGSSLARPVVGVVPLRTS
jgi:Tol biopolymer transport system component